MTASLDGPRAKIERAKEHIRNVEKIGQLFLQTNPYEIFREEDTDAGRYVWRVHVRAQPPQLMSVVIGDALHNLRSALDLLAWQLVLLNKRKPGRIFLPICRSRKEFETKGLREVKRWGANAKAILKGLKPYRGGNDALWRLHKLDIVDKHRFLMTTGAAFAHVTIDPIPLDWDVPTDVRKQMRIAIRPADRLFPLVDGAILYTVSIADAGKMDMNPQFTFEIAFGEGEIVKGEAVIPTLQQFVGLVEEILGLFVPLFP